MLTNESLEKGFGYWLFWHKRALTPVESIRYRKELGDAFGETDLVDLLGRHPVAFAIFTEPVPAHLGAYP